MNVLATIILVIAILVDLAFIFASVAGIMKEPRNAAIYTIVALAQAVNLYVLCNQLSGR